MRSSGYADLFGPRIYSAHDVANGKPAPDLLLLAAERQGVAPADCLVIEDSAAGVTAARRAGMTVFGFVGGSHHSGGDYAQRLKAAGAALIFDDMRKLPELVQRNEQNLRRMAKNGENETARLDDAARAGWLYYVAGNTQDEIARKLGVSRQTAQRLVSLAMSERLIKVRLDHPIARCMELAAALRQRYDLFLLRGRADAIRPRHSTTLGIAQLAAAEMERWLRRPDPVVIGIGTGRTMRAVADQMPQMQCPQHRLVALVGTGKTDGSASFYDVIIRLSDTVRAPHYPMPLPVFTRSHEERELLTSLPSTRSLLALVEQADVSFVGIGSIGEGSALLKDGFMTTEENEAMRKAGAVGEITAWSFDSQGRLIQGHLNERVASAPLRQPAKRPMIGVAMGVPRRAAIRAALTGQAGHWPHHRRGDRRTSVAALKLIYRVAFAALQQRFPVDSAAAVCRISARTAGKCSAMSVPRTPHRRKHA